MCVCFRVRDFGKGTRRICFEGVLFVRIVKLILQFLFCSFCRAVGSFWSFSKLRTNYNASFWVRGVYLGLIMFDYKGKSETITPKL